MAPSSVLENMTTASSGSFGSFGFSRLRFKPPMVFGGLTVVPIRENAAPPVDYVHNREALRRGWVHLDEISDQGVVPELLVRNTGPYRVLFLEAEQLDGGKQNRIINVSVLAPAGKPTVVPVSCVEQGRWSARRESFSSCEHTPTTAIRFALKTSVTRSAKTGQGFLADQHRIWSEVSSAMNAHNAFSGTTSFSALHAARRVHREQYQRAFPWVEGATGLALGLGRDIVSIELFDRPETCAVAWPRLIAGHALDAMLLDEERPADPTVLEPVFRSAEVARWCTSSSPGEGTQLRTAFANFEASMLMLEESRVHASFVRRAG